MRRLEFRLRASCREVVNRRAHDRVHHVQRGGSRARRVQLHELRRASKVDSDFRAGYAFAERSAQVDDHPGDL